jgi:Concanavalin A-like lectin/glucanases superfamily
MLFKKIFLLSSLLGIFGCSSKNDPISTSTNQHGSISFRVSIGADSPFKKIAKSADLNISGPDMLTMIKPLQIKDSTIEGKIDNIPSGINRKFEIRVYDSAGTERYRGSISANIKGDSTVAITLPISRVVGSAIINGTIDEVGINLNDSSTILLFKFDEGAGVQTTDSKNNLVGSLNNTTWTKNGLGYATTFNGTNSYITTTSSSSITIKDTFSIDIIFRSPATTERRVLIGMRQPESLGAEVGADGKVMVDLQGAGAQTTLFGKNRVDDGKWHALSIVHKYPKTFLFVDGIKEGDSTDIVLKMNNSTNLLVGHLNLGEFPGRFFYKGDIDLIRFSKIARTETEAKYIFDLAGLN